MWINISIASFLVLKKKNPLYISKYAVENQVAYEPYFYWWDNEVFKVSKIMIYNTSSNQKHYLRVSYKYGIKAPNSFNCDISLYK